MEFLHQHIFDLFSMLGCFSQPPQDGVFLDPFDPGQCADAIPFCQERQNLQNLFFFGMLVVEDRTFGFGERLAASFALVTLYPTRGFAKLFKVRFWLIALQLPIIWASCVWTEIFGLRKFCHVLSLG